MAATTARQFFEGLLLDLRKGVSDFIDGERVYLIAVPTIDTIGDVAVQVVPGRRTNQHPKSDVPLIEVEFETVLWLRSFRDYAKQDISKLTDETWSAYDLVDRVQQALIGSDAGGTTTIQVQFLSGEKPVTNPAQDGWVTITDRFRASIELEHHGG